MGPRSLDGPAQICVGQEAGAIEVCDAHDARTLAIEAELFMAASIVWPVSANDGCLESLREAVLRGRALRDFACVTREETSRIRYIQGGTTNGADALPSSVFSK